MQGKEQYEVAFFEAISQILQDYVKTIKELDEARSKGKDEYKRECDLFKLDELIGIAKEMLVPKDKELRHILLNLQKAMEAQEKFRDLDLKIQWGLASKLERGKAGFYIVESTEFYKLFDKLFIKKFGK